MAKTFKLSLMTPDKGLFEGQVEAVLLPGEEGELGVLSNHTKFVTTLKPGVVRYVAEASTERYAVGGGFAEVYADGVVVLADSAEDPSEIDLARAEQSRDRAGAELQLVDPGDTARIERLQARLARAENRIKASRSA